MRGICIYTSHHLKAVEVHFPTAAFEEHLWISIDLCGSDRLLIGGIYRSLYPVISTLVPSLCVICFNLLLSIPPTFSSVVTLIIVTLIGLIL